MVLCVHFCGWCCVLCVIVRVGLCVFVFVLGVVVFIVVGCRALYV